MICVQSLWSVFEKFIQKLIIYFRTELRQILTLHARTLYVSIFKPHAHRMHVCILPRFNSHLHTHVCRFLSKFALFLSILVNIDVKTRLNSISRTIRPKNGIEKCENQKILVFIGQKWVFFTQKRAIAIPRRSLEKEPHACTSYARFYSSFARTLHSCKCARRSKFQFATHSVFIF